ncbi:uncharacterized protein METZ01_LOCUS37079 [marine metagenome]|uniref:Uncharacterized protein n=1 Tax=marine metagenome TaxID=408172 RepID=A0A381QXS5_9ZZZZ
MTLFLALTQEKTSYTVLLLGNLQKEGQVLIK